MEVPSGSFTGEVLEKVALALGESPATSDISPSGSAGSTPNVTRSASDRSKKPYMIFTEASPTAQAETKHHSGLFRRKDKDKEKNKLQKKLYRKSHHDEQRKSMSPADDGKSRKSFGGILKRSESGRPVGSTSSLVPLSNYPDENRRRKGSSSKESKTPE